MTGVWWRNPDLYVRHCVEQHALNLVFDGRYLHTKQLDPVKFVELFLGSTDDFRCLVIERFGTAELRRGDTLAKPSAVYPTWDYEIDDIATLEELCENPVGASYAACNAPKCPPGERPVLGQEHRIVIDHLPPGTTGIGRKFLSTLRSMQQDYPDVILHPHGLQTFRLTFGLQFKSMDFDPSYETKRKQVILPNGKTIKMDQAARYSQWIMVLGFKPVEIAVPQNALAYNMKSALWAADHYNDDLRFKTRGKENVDPDAVNHTPATTISSKSTNTPATVGDKFICDACSLDRTCKFYRAGQVCSLPTSETSTLAKMFNSRDPDTIIDGLGALMDVSAKRLTTAVEEEEAVGGKDGPLDPEVTKLINATFTNGVKLAKLLAPQRFSPGLKIMLPNGPSLDGGPPTAQQAVAALVRECEAQGIDPKSLTPDMVENMIGRASAITVPELTAGGEEIDVDSF